MLQKRNSRQWLLATNPSIIHYRRNTFIFKPTALNACMELVAILVFETTQPIWRKAEGLPNAEGSSCIFPLPLRAPWAAQQEVNIKTDSSMQEANHALTKAGFEYSMLEVSKKFFSLHYTEIFQSSNT